MPKHTITGTDTITDTSFPPAKVRKISEEEFKKSSSSISKNSAESASESGSQIFADMGETIKNSRDTGDWLHYADKISSLSGKEKYDLLVAFLDGGFSMQYMEVILKTYDLSQYDKSIYHYIKALSPEEYKNLIVRVASHPDNSTQSKCLLPLLHNTYFYFLKDTFRGILEALKKDGVPENKIKYIANCCMGSVPKGGAGPLKLPKDKLVDIFKAHSSLPELSKIIADLNGKEKYDLLAKMLAHDDVDPKFMGLIMEFPKGSDQNKSVYHYINNTLTKEKYKDFILRIIFDTRLLYEYSLPLLNETARYFFKTTFDDLIEIVNKKSSIPREQYIYTIKMLRSCKDMAQGAPVMNSVALTLNSVFSAFPPPRSPARLQHEEKTGSSIIGPEEIAARMLCGLKSKYTCPKPGG